MLLLIIRNIRIEILYINRETLPSRASIRDFDLDPPLTHKGLKDAYHTGKQIQSFLLLFFFLLLNRNCIKRKRHTY